MKFDQPHEIEEIAKYIGAKLLIGDLHQSITGINEIHKVEIGDITFVDYFKYYKKALNSKASAIIIDQEMDCPEGKTLIISDDPFRDYNALAKRFRPSNLREFSARYHSFYVSDTANIAPDVVIMPGAYIGNEVIIGAGTIIYPNVVINDHVSIGKNVIIQANTVIGGDAFYYKSRNHEKLPKYEKMHTIGKVLIEDDVEIGSGCTIDSGVSGVTIIGAGTKIDNLCMIAHGVVIGKNCLLASQVGIAGKTILEDEVILWAQVGISKALRLGKGSIVLAKSGVGKDTEPGKTYFGIPAIEAKDAWRDIATLRGIRKRKNKD
jgi:UDP-3-O-[3-hydroxymyristoyl] glucosamine N-acyltransferase